MSISFQEMQHLGLQYFTSTAPPFGKEGLKLSLENILSSSFKIYICNKTLPQRNIREMNKQEFIESIKEKRNNHNRDFIRAFYCPQISNNKLMYTFSPKNVPPSYQNTVNMIMTFILETDFLKISEIKFECPIPDPCRLGIQPKYLGPPPHTCDIKELSECYPLDDDTWWFIERLSEDILPK